MKINLSERQRSIIYFIVWVLIHSFSVGLMTLIVNNQKINDYWVILGVMALGITVVAQIATTLWLKKSFKLNAGLLYWFVVNLVGFWIARDILLPLIVLNDVILPILFSGLVLAIIGKVANNVEFGGRYHHSFHIPRVIKLIIGVILILAAFYVIFVNPVFGMAVRLCSDPFSIGLAAGLSGQTASQALNSCNMANLVYYGSWVVGIIGFVIAKSYFD